MVQPTELHHNRNFSEREAMWSGSRRAPRAKSIERQRIPVIPKTSALCACACVRVLKATLTSVEECGGSLNREKGLSVCKSITHVDITWKIPLTGYAIGHKYCNIQVYTTLRSLGRSTVSLGCEHICKVSVPIRFCPEHPVPPASRLLHGIYATS